MSDPVALAVVATIQVVLLALIARMNFNVRKIEKATNSMKDSLVASTDKEAFARGVKSETDKAGKSPNPK